jgi:hypothetical protein
MKRLIVITCAALALCGLARTASAQPGHTGDSKRVDIRVAEPMLVGDTLVAPGDYRFQCRHIDGKDLLVVTTTNGKEIARVPCHPEALEGAVQLSEYRAMKRDDGQRVLKSVRLKGDTVAHVLN